MTGLADRPALVTGAAGFVGANLVRGLLAQGARVHALVRPASDLWRLERVRPSLRLLEADLADPVAVKNAVDGIQPAFVFHLAFPGGHAQGERQRREMILDGVGGTHHLLEALRESHFERLVVLGSFLEYGPHDRPLLESDGLRPATFRGVAKAMATLLCQQFAREVGRPVVILRPFSIYGPWESPGRLVPTAILAAIDGRPLPMTRPGFSRDLVYVADVVEACLMAAVHELDPGEVLNVGTGRQWSNDEVVSAVEEVTGTPIQRIENAHPASLSDTGHSVAETSRARNLLGWTPRVGLRQGLEATFAWLREHLPEVRRRGEVARGSSLD